MGAALGAVFLIAAGELLRPLGALSTFVVSAVALLVILFVPGLGWPTADEAASARACLTSNMV